MELPDSAAGKSLRSSHRSQILQSLPVSCRFKLEKPRLTSRHGQTSAGSLASNTSPNRVRTAKGRELPSLGVLSCAWVSHGGGAC